MEPPGRAVLIGTFCGRKNFSVGFFGKKFFYENFSIRKNFREKICKAVGVLYAQPHERGAEGFARRVPSFYPL